MHYFSRAFLEEAADFLASGRGSYHAARKSVPSKDGPVQVEMPPVVTLGPSWLAQLNLHIQVASS